MGFMSVLIRNDRVFTGQIAVNGGQTVNLVDPLPHGAPPQPGAGHTVHSSTPTPPPSQALPPTFGALLNGEPHSPRKRLIPKCMFAPTLDVLKGRQKLVYKFVDT
jgi:hypothetical protein